MGATALALLTQPPGRLPLGQTCLSTRPSASVAVGRIHTGRSASRRIEQCLGGSGLGWRDAQTSRCCRRRRPASVVVAAPTPRGKEVTLVTTRPPRPVSVGALPCQWGVEEVVCLQALRPAEQAVGRMNAQALHRMNARGWRHPALSRRRWRCAEVRMRGLKRRGVGWGGKEQPVVCGDHAVGHGIVDHVGGRVRGRSQVSRRQDGQIERRRRWRRALTPVGTRWRRR